MLACIRTSAAVDPLLPLCARLTPRLERHPDALVLDLSGCERLVLGRHVLPSTPPNRLGPTLAVRLQHRLRAATSAPITVGLGPSRTVAWLAATTPAYPTPWRAIAPDQVADFLRPLPLAALLALPDLRDRPGAAEVLAALAQSGLVTVGQVARLPAAPLVRRFGTRGTHLATLAAGHDVTPLRVWVPATWLGARLQLDPAVAADQLTSALIPLAEQLATALARPHLGACALALVLRMDDGVTWRATHPLGQPTASPRALHDHAQRLLTALLERVPAALPCAALHLRAGDLRPVAPPQDLLWPHEQQRDRAAARRRLARLLVTSATGLVQATCVAPHAVLPEERFTFVPLHALHAPQPLPPFQAA
jgi:nucleotidyltransferase/DNA polymerase involved in DNA repair